MAYGLQTFFGDGAAQLTITDRTSRYIQTNYVGLGERSGTTIGVSGMVNDGTWGVFCYSPFTVRIYNGYYSIYNPERYTAYGDFVVFRW